MKAVHEWGRCCSSKNSSIKKKKIGPTKLLHTFLFSFLFSHQVDWVGQGIYQAGRWLMVVGDDGL
jgi:hypothetical protein